MAVPAPPALAITLAMAVPVPPALAITLAVTGLLSPGSVAFALAFAFAVHLIGIVEAEVSLLLRHVALTAAHSHQGYAQNHRRQHTKKPFPPAISSSLHLRPPFPISAQATCMP
jgi:hypothetical protein